MGKLGSSALVRQLVLEKENSELKPVKPRLKKWPCIISCPSWGVGKYVYVTGWAEHEMFGAKPMNTDM